MCHSLALTPKHVAAPRDGSRERLFIAALGLVFFRVSAAGAADDGGALASAAENAASAPERLPAHQPANPLPSKAAAEFAVPRYEKWDLSAPIRPLDLPPAGTMGVRLQSSAASVSESRSIPGLNGNLEFDKTLWQRLAEYRSRDRVRVLTLWESTASAVSIQADRKGGPSLQWTSRWMNRGGATRGLLDHWMPMSMFRFSRSSNSPDPVRPTAPSPAVHLGIGTGAVP